MRLARKSALFSPTGSYTRHSVFRSRKPVCYEALLTYLRDGFNLAEANGNKGRALGFVMTIFQKIAASSFAAVGATLRIAVCFESLLHDPMRPLSLIVALMWMLVNEALSDARALLHEMFALPSDALGRAEVERLLADASVKLLRKLGRRIDAEQAPDDESPPLRTRILQQLLCPLLCLPSGSASAICSDSSQADKRARPRNCSVRSGIFGLCIPGEKIVVFTTYLGSVDALQAAIDRSFPNARRNIIKGGDHGAKVAARATIFKRPDGPRVLISAAAGREGLTCNSLVSYSTTVTLPGIQWTSDEDRTYSSLWSGSHGSGLQLGFCGHD